MLLTLHKLFLTLYKLFLTLHKLSLFLYKLSLTQQLIRATSLKGKTFLGYGFQLRGGRNFTDAGLDAGTTDRDRAAAAVTSVGRGWRVGGWVSLVEVVWRGVM